MNKCIIVLPTHSNYLGVTYNFLSLLEKNWNECPYEIWISYTGPIREINKKYNYIYNGINASLTDCLVNAAVQVHADYYFSFLGDAFINSKVNNEWVLYTIDLLEANHIEYCSLSYVKNYYKKRKLDESFRYIHDKDRYSHSFISFIANYSYIKNTISKFATDLEFEEYYLSSHIDGYYTNHLVVNSNFLDIVPSITKGKWDRFAINKIKKNNPEIELENREIESWFDSFYKWLHDQIIFLIPGFMRRGAKRLLSKFTNKGFVTYK